MTADATVMARVEGLREAGVPEADITAALAADGYTLTPADARTDEQREHDAVWGGAKPDAYRIDYMGRMAHQPDVTAPAGFDSEARAWLSEIGFPANIGPSVVEAALDARNRLAAMSEPSRALWVGEQKALFAQLAGGPEKAAGRMALAAKALALGRAGFTDALAGCGALNDATVVARLALQGERITVRENL